MTKSGLPCWQRLTYQWVLFFLGLAGEEVAAGRRPGVVIWGTTMYPKLRRLGGTGKCKIDWIFAEFLIVLDPWLELF